MTLMESAVLKKQPVHVWILGALTLGVLVGIAVNQWWTAQTWQSLGVGDAASYLAGRASEANSGAGFGAGAARFIHNLTKFTGDLFLRLLRLIAVPVVLFSIIGAVAGVGEPKALGRMGARTILVFALTGVLATLIALGISAAVRPGDHVDDATRDRLLAQGAESVKQRVATYEDFSSRTSAWTQLLDAFAPNPFKALADGNMLQIVTLSVMLGVGLLLVQRERRERVVGVVEGLADAVLRLVVLIMKFAPVAVFALSAMLVSNLGLGVLRSVIVFVVCVLGGLVIILLVEYPIVMRLFARRGSGFGVRGFFRAMGPAFGLAFSSSSSAATMPVTMECCDRMGVPRRVTSLVVPLGTTINMDGTALYQVLCVTFLAQLFDVPLSLGDHVTIALMAIVVSIGSPGLPGASIVLMVFILDAFRIPLAGLAIILAVDRLLDMARTVVNVAGDACAAVVVAGFEPDNVSGNSPA